MRFGGFAVAAGAADLLIITLDAGRQIGVEHKAHIALVDAHAEGDGGDHHHIRLGHEGILMRLAHLLRHAGVIGERLDAFRGEERGRFLRALARQAIDDAALARPRFDEGQQLLLPALLRRHGELDVGTVETQHDRLDMAGEQLRRDIGARAFVRRRGQRHDGHARERLAQARQRFVVRAERRAPLRDAMRFVDCDQTHRQFGERRQHLCRHQPFGRKIEKPRLPARGAAPGGDVVIAIARGVDRVGRHTRELQRRHLILHEGDQRRDDDGQAAQYQRRHLEAERFARARRHDGEDIASLEHRIHRLLLPRPERAEAEHIAQDVELRRHGDGGGRHGDGDRIGCGVYLKRVRDGKHPGCRVRRTIRQRTPAW